jgi:hypothetical protein
VVENKREEETAPQRTNESLVVELNKKKLGYDTETAGNSNKASKVFPIWGTSLTRCSGIRSGNCLQAEHRDASAAAASA